MLTLPHLAAAQTAPAIPPSLVTPDKVETRIGTLEFKDGAPSKATAEKVYDNLDFTYAYRAFVDTMQGVSIHALRKGMQSVGVKDNEVIVFSELMDAKSLFLTANADTVYVMGVLDLTQGTRGAGDAAQVARRHRRRLVPLGHRPRRARPRSRRGRQVPDRAAGLRRPAAGGRILRRPRPDQHRRVVRPLVPGEPERSEAGRRGDPEVHQGLSLRARRRRHARSPSSWPARPSSGGSRRRRRPCSTKAAAR